MHLGNGKCKKTGKGTRYNASTKKDGHTPLNFVAFVVHADQVDAAFTDISCQPLLRHAERRHTWNDPGLEEPQQNSAGDEALHITDKSHANS
ncbi:unnamed protein product [Fusarium graminearum]|nr:unnamed protein product [Fusarium graminearum]CAG1978266.1 unnamed protein product [Fusarium graminearum]VTO84994.1 unnamed protein product [Fusarium graminearum]